ncbi:mechanosensitive ion channel family protein [Aliiroseovarius sp. S1339]|uniref:mechanosensitive ion channel family protein n=1 Tax=Aliiroseovarius sp. S1339 TaxID=2936990 RepID=UPI0020BF8B44|nr:mechanosensitive ion channel family protein [Aliiroseovarius sp. S1339]MCK8463195.1 mechanosensitive ion channel family protein [Aliiroseovarius sp. S1339]
MEEAIAYLNTQWSAVVKGVSDILPELVAALAVIALTWGLSRFAKMIIARLGGRMHLRSNLIEVLSMLASVGLWLIGTLIAVTLVFPSITPAKALTTLGLGSVAIGFAFKDTFENFLAGILILLREPFALGDFVECEDIEGQVEKITIRDTHIRQTDGQLVVVPNHMLFQNPVTVRTSRDLRRITVICGVAYGEDIDIARDVISKAVRNVDTVRDDVKDVQIFATNFGASSVDFEVTWWTGSKPIDVRQSRDQVIAAVKRALDDKGIEIPFPYRTLTVNEPIPVTQVSE